MKINLKDITDQGTELDFTQEESWVSEAVARVDEPAEMDASADIKPASVRAKSRPIHARLSLRRVDEVVVVSGKIETAVHLICSRCANYYDFETRPQFSALFCKDPVLAGIAHFQRDGDESKPSGKNHGFARHAHDFAADEDERSEGTETGKDLDITYISSEHIDLGDVLTEQLRLQIPFQPLCKEDCQGICAQCGADLNQGRCACAKIGTHRPLSALKHLKIGT